MTHCLIFVFCIAIAVEAFKLWIRDLVVPGAVGTWGKKPRKTKRPCEEEHAFLYNPRQQMATDGGAQGTDEIILACAVSKCLGTSLLHNLNIAEVL